MKNDIECFLLEHFTIHADEIQNRDNIICTHAGFSRKGFAQLYDVLGENFFDYIKGVTVWQDLEEASVELSQKACKKLCDILYDK
ncbi:MAG: hypothetical protein J6B33_02555 [Prevotella sp.]|nr:hypothetical protein [Prevotella sp.]